MTETTNTEQTEEKTPLVLSVISAEELHEKAIEPVHYVVDEIIPTGLDIIAAPSKYGKSWLSLDLCLSVASGGWFLGHATSRCGCLYLALEDSERRLKERMERLLSGRRPPSNFYYATNSHTIDDGLFEELEDFLKKHPETGLIIIDTLQKVRGVAHMKEGAYATDYREIGALKTFADKHKIALILIHHLRKMRDDGDVFAMLSGTNGIMGAADTIFVLMKERRSSETATLSIVGRDVESAEITVQFNRDTCKWENLGDADWVAEQRALNDYQQSPLVKTIKALLKQSGGRWRGTAKQLMAAGTYIVHKELAVSTHKLGRDIVEFEGKLLEFDGIMHTREKNGTGGGKHEFYYVDAVCDEDAEQIGLLE